MVLAKHLSHGSIRPVITIIFEKVVLFFCPYLLIFIDEFGELFDWQVSLTNVDFLCDFRTPRSCSRPHKSDTWSIKVLPVVSQQTCVPNAWHVTKWYEAGEARNKTLWEVILQQPYISQSLWRIRLEIFFDYLSISFFHGLVHVIFNNGRRRI